MYQFFNLFGKMTISCNNLYKSQLMITGTLSFR